MRKLYREELAARWLFGKRGVGMLCKNPCPRVRGQGKPRAEWYRGELEEQLEAQAALVPELVEALKAALPILENTEAETLLGDEGCLWPVELVRAAIAFGLT